MTVRAKLRDIARAAQNDPKKALLDALPINIDKVEVFHNLVLVATYIEPELTAGGIIKPDRTLMESRFQGKCALVLRLGPLAFQDDQVAKFGGIKIEPGDWVVVRPSDGMELFAVEKGTSEGTSCRIFEDVKIMARVHDPNLIH